MSSSKPPRSALTVRDMVAAMGVLLLVVLVVGGAARGCSFSPGGPTVDQGALPVVDAPAELRDRARFVEFPVRVPALPPDWRSNATGRDLVDPADPAAGSAVRAGWLTPQGRYLRLLQSDASEEALLRTETGADPVAARGTVDVAGVRFVVYGGGGDEEIWIGELPGGPRVLITGSADGAGFTALAGATIAGEVLPLGTTPG